MYYGMDSDFYNGAAGFELEKDEIGEFTLHGIHYVSVWLTETVVKETVTDWIPIINVLKDPSTKDYGAYHCIIKFEPDGSYRYEYLFYNEKNIKNLKKSQFDDTRNWENTLPKRYDTDNDDTRRISRSEMDVYNPKEWHDISYSHMTEDTYTTVKKAMVNVVDWLKTNRPEIIQQNIALNNRDEATALAQHKSETENSYAADLQKNAVEVAASHPDVLSGYNKDPKQYLHGLGIYTWDMFLNENVPRPDIDVNTLINNAWYLDYVGPSTGFAGPDGYVRSREDNYSKIVRFQPVFLVNSQTAEIAWEYSLLEMTTLYYTNYNYTYHQKYEEENFSLELARWNGKFNPNVSIVAKDGAPLTAGEKKVYFNHSPREGDFITRGATPFYYEFKAGKSDNDFWLIEYYEGDGGKPTRWYYHLTTIE